VSGRKNIKHMDGWMDGWLAGWLAGWLLCHYEIYKAELRLKNIELDNSMQVY
jgi:hypothetical protein